MSKRISKIIDRNSYFLDRGVILIKDNGQLPKDISIGIILDTAFTIPPKTGVCYRLYYLSKELIKNGINVRLFLCNRNYRNDEEVKALSREENLEIHLIPEKILMTAPICKGVGAGLKLAVFILIKVAPAAQTRSYF